MKRLFLPMILFSVFILGACGASEPERGASVADAAESTLHEMSITATAEGWDAPASTPDLDGRPYSVVVVTRSGRLVATRGDQPRAGAGYSCCSRGWARFRSSTSRFRRCILARCDLPGPYVG